MNSLKKLKENSNAATSGDILALFHIINYFHPVSNPQIEFFLREHLTQVHFRKGKLLLKAGEICNHVYFIKKGAVRGFIREGGKDRTTWITADGEMVYVADGGKAKAVTVKTGRNSNGMVEILEGLQTGDKVVVEGYADLDNGKAIEIR